MTWPQDAYVGQKVVRFRNAIHPLDNLDIHKVPEIGETVTINWIELNYFYDLIFIDLIEYPAPATSTYMRGWDIRIFRPAQSTEKGMSILREILITKKVREDA